MARGRFSHASIAAAQVVRGECAVGWASHYSIGFALAFVFLFVVPGWSLTPSLLPALLYGVGTVVLPLFVLQPALGLGVASSRVPSPWAARLKSLGTHLVFGVGLYLSALLFAQVERIS